MAQGQGMDGVNELLAILRRSGQSQGNFLGLLNVLIGRRIVDAQGAVLSTGLTWRALAALLKKVRWEKEAVRELGLDPRNLPPRDRERFWYSAIAQAGVDTSKAIQAGDKFRDILQEIGYQVGPGPQPK
jgi:hypothetical protein